jgi:hypothetical protein
LVEPKCKEFTFCIQFAVPTLALGQGKPRANLYQQAAGRAALDIPAILDNRKRLVILF